MSAFDFEPAFGGNNSVSAGNVSGNTGVVGPITSGTSGGFNWTNTLKSFGEIAVPIATGLIQANQTKVANKAAAKEAERQAAMQAEYLRAQLAAQANANASGNTSGKMPTWLWPVAAVVGVVVLIGVFMRTSAAK